MVKQRIMSFSSHKWTRGKQEEDDVEKWHFNLFTLFEHDPVEVFSKERW